MEPSILILLAGIAAVVVAIMFFRLHAFFALMLGAIVVGALTEPTQIGPNLKEGFGIMCGKVGIVIGMAAIIGKCLLDSGAAERIVIGIRNLFGDKRLSPAFATSSFVLGIPVFFDTVFYLLLPLGRAAARKTGKNYLLFVLSIVAGATMAHSLVPPTPGPLLVASELGVPLINMIIGGLIVGVITVTCGLAYARWANRKWNIPLRETDFDAETEEKEPSEAKKLPALSFCLLPLILPLVLLAADNLVDLKFKPAPLEEWPAWAKCIVAVGDKNIALTIAAIASLILLASQKSKAALPGAVQKALASGGVIILVTAAGGAFGHIIKENSGIIEWLKDATPSGQLVILPIAFGITTLVRIAQGSATVAMVTAIGIVGALATGLTYNPVYLALAIGCGSKPIPWMNDSGFCVIYRMSGMTEAEALKTASVMMSGMGVVGLIVVMLGASFFPLV